jgi:hypothetical protein
LKQMLICTHIDIVWVSLTSVYTWVTYKVQIYILRIDYYVKY